MTDQAADLLRRAAVRAQELADGVEGATGVYPGTWWGQDANRWQHGERPEGVSDADAALVAACDPPFLRAVGEWLEGLSLLAEEGLPTGPPMVMRGALAVARALLGES